MNSLTLEAHSKINLGLDVLRRRPDGYHEVRMVMQTLGLHDTLTLTSNDSGLITLQTGNPEIPTGPDNLICRAGKLLMEEFHITAGVHVFLDKQIPVAAGMAGGSTDAAAMMIGINHLFGLGLTRKELMERGVKIGADVPYCILQGTALAEGIGEKLTALVPMRNCPVLIAKPDISVSTKFVYTHLRLDEETIHPDIDGITAAIISGDFDGIASRLGNVLETVTIPAYPVITRIKEKMISCGAANAMMSGSGPTVFGLFCDYETARNAYLSLKESGLARQVFLTDLYTPDALPEK